MSSGTITEQGLLQKTLYLLRLSFKPLCVCVCLLYVYGILYLVFLPDEGSHEDSKSAWCEEYHPNLTYSACADVVVGAQFTGTANPWCATGDVNRLKGALGVKEVKIPLTSIIEDIQIKINTARVEAGSQYSAIESAVSYATDLTVQYELGKNVVNELNFSKEAAHLAKAQILQDAASAMLIQANNGQRGLIGLII